MDKIAIVGGDGQKDKANCPDHTAFQSIWWVLWKILALSSRPSGHFIFGAKTGVAWEL